MEKIRLFVGLSLPSSVAEQLANGVAERWGHLPLRWVAQQNYHVTLKFIGDWQVSGHQGLVSVISEVAAQWRPLRLAIENFGAFPNWDAIEVLWAQVQVVEGELNGLVVELEDRLSELGIAREAKAYVPHITVARVRQAVQQLQSNSKGSISAKIGEFSVTDLALFKSTLTPEGSQYSILGRFPLVGDG